MTSKGATTEIIHSPLPWRLSTSGRFVNARPNEYIADCTVNDDDELVKGNAALIVQAVNSHAELVSALELCFRRLEHKAATCKNHNWKVDDQEAFEKAQAALARVRN